MARRRTPLIEGVLGALADSDLQNKEIADALGVRDSTVSRWRLGTATPDRHHAEQLAELLGAPVVGPRANDDRVSQLEARMAALEADLHALAAVVHRLTSRTLDDDAEQPGDASRPDRASE